MKTRFTDEQIIQMLKEQEAGEKTADLCRRYDISQGTFYKSNRSMTAWSHLMRRGCERWKARMHGEETIGGANAR